MGLFSVSFLHEFGLQLHDSLTLSGVYMSIQSVRQKNMNPLHSSTWILTYSYSLSFLLPFLPFCHTPIFSVLALSPFLALCVIRSYFLSSDTVKSAKYLLTSFSAQSVSSRPTTCHISFFSHLIVILSLMQRDWRMSPRVDMQRGCGGRMSEANCWKPLAPQIMS